MDFYHLLIDQKGLSKATASKYDLVIRNRIAEWLPSYEVPKNSIEFEALKQSIFSLDIYKERNHIGNNMYSSALNHYGNYLKEYDVYDQSIFNEEKTFTADAEKLIKVRLLQNKFRKKLFELYPYCAVTGYKNSQFLIASHIKPWSKSENKEKIDGYNGLLLTPNFDRLFDRGFISFDQKGNTLLSHKLAKADVEFLNIPSKSCLEFNSSHQYYLEFHRDTIFEK